MGFCQVGIDLQQRFVFGFGFLPLVQSAVQRDEVDVSLFQFGINRQRSLMSRCRLFQLSGSLQSNALFKIVMRSSAQFLNRVQQRIVLMRSGKFVLLVKSKVLLGLGLIVHVAESQG